jgi:hypothetical protein
MVMESWARSIGSCLAAAVLCFSGRLAVAGDERGAPDIPRLVRQLGSGVFAERESASRRLIELGIATRDALVEASNDPDAEVRARARVILASVSQSDFRDRLAAFATDYDGSQRQSLPGWEQFTATFCDTRQARQLFVEMQRAEPELLAASAEGGKIASDALNARCHALLQQMTQLQITRSDELMPLGTLASLLWIGSADGVAVDEQLGVQLYSQMIYQPMFQKNVRSGAWSGMLKKLLGLWIVKDSTPVSTVQNLNFGAYYELKAESLNLASKVLASDGGPPQTRQFALLAIGRFGGKEHLPLVEKFLPDATACGTIQVNNPPRQVELQLRDVALAVLVHLTGQRARDYSATTVQPSPQPFFQVASLLFPEKAQRESALKRWSEWRAEHPQP